MNIGITFGGYCPLHQGHLDLIMRAKKENDFCFVFVCGYPNDRGGEELPLIKRYRIISNFLKDEKIKVCMIDDAELGLDESMSASNWEIWLNALCDQIKIDSTNTYHWYCAESSYVTHIQNFNSNFVVHFANRTINPVSGTLCRKFPLHYWHKITAPFRAYYSHNILITGTASEGKTTLTRDIGKYFNLPYSYEKGRDNCALKTDPEFNIKDFIYNIYEQHKYNESLICSPQNPGIFVSDTDNCVTLMYALAYSKREGFGINKEEYNLLYNLAKAYMKTTKWNKIFLIRPSKKGIIDDGERYMPDSDYMIRIDFYNTLKQLYEEFGYEVEELSYGYYGNFCRVREYINAIYERGY